MTIPWPHPVSTNGLVRGGSPLRDWLVGGCGRFGFVMFPQEDTGGRTRQPGKIQLKTKDI